jgi:MYXO-CTERM domain-containing protein
VKNLIGFLGLAAVLCTAGVAEAQTYPTNGWTNLTRGGSVITDVQGEIATGHPDVDVVGNSTYPAAQITSDGTYLMMRLRLNSPPSLSTYGYGCQISVTDTVTAYKYMIVSPKTTSIALWQNTSAASPEVPGDQAESPVVYAPTATAASIASTGDGSNFGSTADAWVELAIPLAALGQSDNNNPLPLRFVCGTNSNGNPVLTTGGSADVMGDETASSGKWTDIMSDKYFCDATGCHVPCSSSADCSYNALTPICNTGTGQCISCIAAGADDPAQDTACANKSASKPVCQADGSCGICDADDLGTCTAGQFCLVNTAPTPDTQTCVACLQNSDCMDAASPYCRVSDHTCQPCADDSGCTGHAGTPACMGNGTCSVCNVADEATTCTSHLCSVTSNVGTCVPCLDADVSTWANCDALHPICSSNTCVACGSSTDCMTKSSSFPRCEADGSCGVCGPAGTDKGACADATPKCLVDTGPTPDTETCVQCLSNSDCDPNSTKPFCDTTTTHTCVACTSEGGDAASRDAACNTLTSGAKPTCEGDGSCGICSPTNLGTCAGGQHCYVDSGTSPSTESCVACLMNADCGNTTTPHCDGTHTCVTCGTSDLTGDLNCTLPGLATGGLSCQGDGSCGVCNVADEGTLCPSMTPKCIVAAGIGTCHECGSNDDCVGNVNGPHCTDSHTCGPCVTGSDCTADSGKTVCDTVNKAPATCVQCTPTMMTACAAISDKTHCSTTTGQDVCVQCNTNSDCYGSPAPAGGGLADPTCNTDTHQCGPCSVDGDCATNPAGLVCDNRDGSSTKGQCVQCLDGSVANCPDGKKHCDITLSPPQCTECNSAMDCMNVQGKPYCQIDPQNGNHCVAGCTSDGDCPTNPRRTCVKEHTSDTPALDLIGTCVECTAFHDPAVTCPTANTAAGLTVCEQATGTCVQCVAQMDCNGNLAGSVCDPVKNTCGQCLFGDTLLGDPACVALDPGKPFCNSSNTCQAPCLSDQGCAANNPATPVCNAQLGHVCTQCEFTPPDGTCPQAKPLCSSAGLDSGDPPKPLPTAGSCVECNSLGDCINVEGRHLCGTKPGNLKTCVQCNTTGDCPEGTCINSVCVVGPPPPDAPPPPPDAMPGAPDAMPAPDAMEVPPPDAPEVQQPDAMEVPPPDAMPGAPDARPAPDAMVVVPPDARQAPDAMPVPDAKVSPGDAGKAPDAMTPPPTNTDKGVVEGGGISCSVSHGDGAMNPLAFLFLGLFAWRSRRRR